MTGRCPTRPQAPALYAPAREFAHVAFSSSSQAAIDQPPAERGAAAKAVTTEAVAAANADMSLLLAPYQALVKAM